MSFVKPMLASPLKDESASLEGWVAEEKYDGHRLCITVEDGEVEALTRDQNDRHLPRHVETDLARLPNGIYDGELISTTKTKSYGVTDLTQVTKLQVVLFDVTHLLGRDVTGWRYTDRRAFLEEIFRTLNFSNGVALAKAYHISGLDAARNLARIIWDRGGEGLILKDTSAPYQVGKRSRQWLKIKQCCSSVLTVVGFVAGLLGPHAVVLLEDADGNRVTVKTRNDQERARIGRNPTSFVGRKLRIEFQERTPDGGYRHPMWDRWEEE